MPCCPKKRPENNPELQVYIWRLRTFSSFLPRQARWLNVLWFCLVWWKKSLKHFTWQNLIPTKPGPSWFLFMDVSKSEAYSAIFTACSLPLVCYFRPILLFLLSQTSRLRFWSSWSSFCSVLFFLDSSGWKISFCFCLRSYAGKKVKGNVLSAKKPCNAKIKK